MGVPSNRNSIKETQRILRGRICRHGPPAQIQYYEKERSTLRDVIQRTAELGESNSILVIGPRGAGKTMLLKSILKEFEDNEVIKNNLLQVHLNGLLQTDDRIALKEITRQLKLENTVGDRVFGSFSENLQFLLDALRSGGKHSKSILFVLDEFDLFAQHKNQTLLYNLFDVSQASMAPVCILGMTTRLDVIELLEKRVKSRFSHRQLHLLPTALTFAEYVDVFRAALSLPNSGFPDAKFAREWNKRIEVLCAEVGVQDVLARRFSMDKDICHLHSLMSIPVCKLTEQRPFLEAADFVDAAKHFSLDSKAAMLHGVSILELCLIIAMKHLSETYDGEPFNFEMVYREYSRFASRRSQQMFDKAVVLKAFEHLLELELVSAMDGGGSKLQKEYRLMTLLIDPSQLSTALQNYPACPTDVRQWAASAIV